MQIAERVAKLAVGAAFGTSKSGIGIAGLGTFKPELIMKVRECLRLPLSPIIHARPRSMAVVPHSRGHVRYHCRVRAGGLRAYCRRT